jgi:hypothetical protein
MRRGQETTEEGHPMESREEDAIDSALAVVAFYQNNVAHADTKIGVLCVAQVGFALALVNSDGMTGGGPVPPHWPLVACTAAFLVAGYHLVQALRPRMSFGGRTRREFHALGPDNRLRVEDAWRMARILSGIARTKNQHIRRCIPWVAIMLSVIVMNGVAELSFG